MLYNLLKKWEGLSTIGKITLIVGAIIPFGFMILGVIAAIKLIVRK